MIKPFCVSLEIKGRQPRASLEHEMGAPSNAVDPSSTTLSAEDMDSADADADQEPLDLIHLGQTSFDGSFNAVLYSKKDFDVTDADQAAKFLKEVYNYLTYLQIPTSGLIQIDSRL